MEHLTVRVGRRRLPWSLSILAAFLLASTAGPVTAQPRTLVVDKDKAQCPNADFVSIQEAVSARHPRTTPSTSVRISTPRA